MKPSLKGEVEVKVLQEGLVGATTIGSKKDSLIRSHVEPMLQVTMTSFLALKERGVSFFKLRVSFADLLMGFH